MWDQHLHCSGLRAFHLNLSLRFFKFFLLLIPSEFCFGAPRNFFSNTRRIKNMVGLFSILNFMIIEIRPSLLSHSSNFWTSLSYPLVNIPIPIPIPILVYVQKNSIRKKKEKQKNACVTNSKEINKGMTQRSTLLSLH